MQVTFQMLHSFMHQGHQQDGKALLLQGQCAIAKKRVKQKDALANDKRSLVAQTVTQRESSAIMLNSRPYTPF